MERNGSPLNTVYEFQSGFKGWVSRSLGGIVGVAGMVGAFLVSLLYNPDGTIGVKDKFYDMWFWVIWAVVFIIAISVSFVNYRVSKRDAKDSPDYVETMKQYKVQKDKSIKNIDVLEYFVANKEKQLYELAEQKIVNGAGLNYANWKDGQYTNKELSKWQIKKISQIKKIRIKQIGARDLTQESTDYKGSLYSLLPQSEKEAEVKFISSKAVTRAVSTFAMLLVGTLTFSYSGWVSAVTNAFGILFAWVGAGLSGSQFVLSDLRNRFVAKTDLLQEFNDNADYYVELYSKRLKTVKIEAQEQKVVGEVAVIEKEPKIDDFKGVEEDVTNNNQ